MSDVSLQLEQDEAIVLFEALSRWAENDHEIFKDSVDEQAFLAVLAALEKTLVEPFRPNYPQILAAAQQRLRARGGRK